MTTDNPNHTVPNPTEYTTVPLPLERKVSERLQHILENMRYTPTPEKWKDPDELVEDYRYKLDNIQREIEALQAYLAGHLQGRLASKEDDQ